MKYLLILVLGFAAFAQPKALSVDVAADRTVTIRVPLDPAFQPFVVRGMVARLGSMQKGASDSFQSSDLHGAEFRRVQVLPPGDYWVRVALRNLDSEGRMLEARFTVR
jgi:hypothetical protein